MTLRPVPGDESGETYVEILVTLVIIGLAGIAILGAIMTSIRSSSLHRNLANVETVLKSSLEQAKYEVELAPSPFFADCSASNTASTLVTTWNSDMSGLWPAVPSGIGNYQAWISKVECFSGKTGSYGLDTTCQASLSTPTAAAPTGVASAGCSNDASGIVEMTVSVLDPTSQTSSISTLIRNPSYGSYSF